MRRFVKRCCAAFDRRHSLRGASAAAPPAGVEPHGPALRATFPHSVMAEVSSSHHQVGSATCSWQRAASAAAVAAASEEERRRIELAGVASSIFASNDASGIDAPAWSMAAAPASPRVAVHAPPSSSHLSSGGAAEAERQAESDAMALLVSRLSPERRRYLLVAAAAEEWYGATRVGRELRSADNDLDARVSESDYRAWVQSVFEKRCGLSRREFALTALTTAIPFVAFGMLDNSVMVLSGDFIDRAVGQAFHLSGMAAAGLGGICSGTLGIQVHGLAERAVQALGFVPPPLTNAQRRHPSFFRATHIGGTVGVCVGLTLGMTPLLFLPE